MADLHIDYRLDSGRTERMYETFFQLFERVEQIHKCYARLWF